MTKQDIYAILDKNVKANRTNMWILLVVGIGCAIGDVCIFIYMKDPGFILYLFGFMGIVFPAAAIFQLATKAAEKEAIKIKDIFDNRPAELVWGYQLTTKRRSGTSNTVVMHFRDKSKFEILEEAIPNSDCPALVRALTVINPDMEIGYSQEKEAKYK